jgi:hypothetical protein
MNFSDFKCLNEEIYKQGPKLMKMSINTIERNDEVRTAALNETLGGQLTQDAQIRRPQLHIIRNKK